MPDLLPRMAPDPPPGYVAFVAQHLEPLRRDALRVVGAQRHPDELYPEVLTDVAARWGWLELLSTRFGRDRAADTYLSQAFARQSLRWRADQPDDDELRPIELEVWHSDLEPAGMRGPVGTREPAGAPDPAGRPAPAPVPPQRSSIALRLAPQLGAGADADADVGPVAEAAIAWLHAYTARRRHQIITTVVLVMLAVLVVMRVSAGL